MYHPDWDLNRFQFVTSDWDFNPSKFVTARLGPDLNLTRLGVVLTNVFRRRLWSWTTRFDIHSFNLTRPRGEGNRTSPEEHQITSYNLACVVSAKLQNKKYKKTFFLFSPLNHQTPKRSKSKISQKKYVSKTLFSHLDYFFFSIRDQLVRVPPFTQADRHGLRPARTQKNTVVQFTRPKLLFF